MDEGEKMTFLGYALCEAQTQNTRKVKMKSNTGQIINVGSLGSGEIVGKMG